MKKLSLTEWAAAGEIVGTIAVVISLLFVGYSINRNTDATQASSENILFERHTDLANHFMTDPSLAELMVKRRNGNADLTGAETIRWEKYELNMLDIWALAHSRYQRELLSDDQWVTWHTLDQSPPGHRCADYGDESTYATKLTDPSFRSRQPVYER